MIWMSKRTIWLKLKQKGLKPYIALIFKKFKVIAVPKYDKLYVFEILLSDIGAITYDKKIKVRIARKIDDIASLIQKRETWFQGQARSLFDQGNLCFVAEIDGQIVSCLWTSFHEVYLPDVKYLLRVTHDVVPLIDGFTLEEYRGGGIYKSLWNYCLEYFKNLEGFNKIYGFIMPINKSSLIVHEKLQLNKIILVIKYLRVFGFSFHFVKKVKNRF